MKTKRRWLAVALLVVVPLFLFAILREKASWRPQAVLGKAQISTKLPAKKISFVGWGGSSDVILVAAGETYQWWNIAEHKKLCETRQWMLGARSPNWSWMVRSYDGFEWKRINNKWQRQASVELRDPYKGWLQKKLWDSRIRDTDKDDAELSVSFTADSRHLVLVTRHAVRCWEIPAGRLLWYAPLAHSRPPNKSEALLARISPDGKLIALGRGGLTLFDSRTGQVVRQVARYGKTIYDVGFIANGQVVYALSNDTYDFYRTRDGRKLWSLAWRDDAHWAGWNNEVFCYPPGKSTPAVLDAFSGKIIRELPGPKLPGRYYMFVQPSPDGNWLMTDEDGNILRWRAR